MSRTPARPAAVLGLALAACTPAPAPVELSVPLPAFLQLGELPTALSARLEATGREDGVVYLDEALALDAADRRVRGEFDLPPGAYDLVIRFTITEPFAELVWENVEIAPKGRREINFATVVPRDLGVDSDADGATDLQELTYGVDPTEPPCNPPCTSETVANGAELIDEFEASIWSEPGCSGSLYGAVGDDYPAGFPDDADSAGVTGGTPASATLYACSAEGVLPSRFVTWYQAKLACENAGKTLCTAAQRTAACASGGCAYPYDPETTTCNCGFVCANVCNESAARGMAPTGSFRSCAAANGALDLSGNLAEWTLDCSGDDCEQRGGSFAGSGDSGAPWSCADTTVAGRGSYGASVGFRCCSP